MEPVKMTASQKSARIWSLRAKRGRLGRLRRQWFDWREGSEDRAAALLATIRRDPSQEARLLPWIRERQQDAVIARAEVADLELEIDRVNLELWSLVPPRTRTILVEESLVG